MLNNWVGQGRLVRDPELKQTQSGVSVCNFTIAVDRDYKNGDEREADFVDVVCWRNTAEFVSKFFSKGRMAIVTGPFQSRKWEDKDGKKRTSWEVQAQNVYFGDSKKDGGQTASAEQAPKFTDVSDSNEPLPF